MDTNYGRQDLWVDDVLSSLDLLSYRITLVNRIWLHAMYERGLSVTEAVQEIKQCKDMKVIREA